MKAEAMRQQILDLLKKRPFEPFILTFDSGEKIIVEHPENMAYDPAPKSSADTTRFSVVSSRINTFGTFDAISTITTLDERVASRN